MYVYGECVRLGALHHAVRPYGWRKVCLSVMDRVLRVSVKRELSVARVFFFLYVLWGAGR